MTLLDAHARLHINTPVLVSLACSRERRCCWLRQSMIPVSESAVSLSLFSLCSSPILSFCSLRLAHVPLAAALLCSRRCVTSVRRRSAIGRVQASSSSSSISCCCPYTSVVSSSSSDARRRSPRHTLFPRRPPEACSLLTRVRRSPLLLLLP